MVFMKKPVYPRPPRLAGGAVRTLGLRRALPHNGTELSRRRNAPRYLAGETPCKAYATAGRTQLPARVLHPETRYKRRTLQNAARSAVGCSEWLGRPMSWMTSPGVEPERYLG